MLQKKDLKINIFFCCNAARVNITLNIKVCIVARVLHTNKGYYNSKRIFCRLDRIGEPKLSVKLLCVQFAFPFLSIRLCFIQKILWCPSDLQTFVQNHGSWTYYFEFYRLFFLECIFLSEYLKFVSFFTNQKAVVEWAVKFKNSLLKKVCGQWFYTKVWRSENRKRTHAGAWESNEWTKQEISLDQLVLPAQDKKLTTD